MKIQNVFNILSKVLLKERPICQICVQKESVNVHHIVHRSKSKYLYLDEVNLLSLCRTCHNKLHGQMRFVTVFDYIEQDEIFDRIIGKEGIEYLKAMKHQIKHWYDDELKEKCKEYRRRLKNG